MAALVTIVAFQIAKFVAFFTIENKHGHDQTAAKCNTDYWDKQTMVNWPFYQVDKNNSNLETITQTISTSIWYTLFNGRI